ncbi:MAG: hypothetical protein AAGB29_02195 [Planctomycetota bacterium]
MFRSVFCAVASSPLLLALAAIVVGLGITPAVSAQSPNLAAQLAEARENHRLLFELADRSDAKYAENVNLIDPVLRQIVIPIEHATQGPDPQVALPEHIDRLWSYFNALWIVGKQMDKTDKIVLVQDGQTSPVKWIRYGDGILIRPQTLSFNGDAPATLAFTGAAKPELIRLETRGLSSKFDPSPYIGVGEDRPRQPVTVTVSTRHWRSIGGVSELDRTKYFRIYSQPGNERYPYYQEELDALGFQQGRQMFKFAPALETRYGQNIEPKLREDPNRPGYHDALFFDAFDNDSYAAVDPDLRFAMCFDNWPSFMAADIPGQQNTRGAPDDFDAAAELVVDYLNDQIADSGRTATWWEVKNESDITYEWPFHSDPDSDGWGLLIDFHNTIADAVHERVDADVKIGGPTAAWPVFEANGFGRWRDFQRFHDGTADHLDFFSYHAYDPAVYGPGDPHGYLDARLDMIQSHMQTTDGVLPLVFSEFGVYGEPAKSTADGREWVIAKGISPYWLRFLDRPEQLDLVVPFMLGFVHWNPTSTRGVWAHDENGEFYRTASYDVMRLWSDFAGRRVPVSSNDPGFLQHAVLDGDTLHIAMYNGTEDRAAVDLKLDVNAPIASIRQKRMYYSKGELIYSDEPVRRPSGLPVNVAETSMVVVRFGRPPVPRGTLAERRYYGADTAIPNAGSPIAFTIETPGVENADVEAAELRLSMHRGDAAGLGSSVTIDINGRSVTHDLSRFGDEGYFGYTQIPLPANALREANQISIAFDKPGGTMGSAVLAVTTRED